MSPLARSLLALAALLAAADAKITRLLNPPGSPCSGFIMDIPTQQPYDKVIEEISFNWTLPDGYVWTNITNLCAAIGAEVASERVEVCNIYPYPTMELSPPSVSEMRDEVLSPVYVSCDRTYKRECGPVTINITQKCRTAPKFF